MAQVLCTLHLATVGVVDSHGDSGSVGVVACIVIGNGGIGMLSGLGNGGEGWVMVLSRYPQIPCKSPAICMSPLQLTQLEPSNFDPLAKIGGALLPVPDMV